MKTIPQIFCNHASIKTRLNQTNPKITNNHKWSLQITADQPETLILPKSNDKIRGKVLISKGDDDADAQGSAPQGSGCIIGG